METLNAQSAINAPVAAGIWKRLTNSQYLIASGNSKFATILLWSAFEAAVRISLTDLGQQTDNPIWASETPQGLLVQAVAYGIIDPEDREILLRFLSQRDAVSGPDEAVDAETLSRIEYITKRTIDEMQPKE